MKNLGTPWKSWLHWRVLLIGIGLGLVGAVTLWAEMRIPLYPQLNIAADVREFFVVIGAWYLGPIGGLLTGAVSAAYSPIANPFLHFSSWIAHSLAGLALGLVYSPRNDLTARNFVFLWVRAILTYYLVLIVVLIVFISLLVPSFFLSPDLPGGTVLQNYVVFISAVLPELGFVLVLTLIGMLALPKKYRKPLWSVDKPNNP